MLMAWDFDTYIGLSDHREHQVPRLDLQYPSEHESTRT